MVDTRNRAVERPGSTRQALESRWISELKLKIKRLTQFAADHPMRELAEQEVLGLFLSLHSAGQGAGVTLEQLYNEHHLRLEVTVTAMTENRTLSKAQLDAEVQSYATRGQTNTQQSQDRRMHRKSGCAPDSGLREPVEGSSSITRSRTDPQRTEPLRPPRYTTELGLRELSIDPETNNMIIDLSGLAADRLGYDPSLKLPPAEFLAREEAQEQRAIDRARLQGRYPNTDICRMCRDFARVLRPNKDGFELTAQRCILPFGNFHQLTTRQHCKICRLIYSAITTTSGELDPQLSAIDREVQGTRLSTGTLSSGDKVMRVDYGLRHVCDLRIVTQQNRRQTIRQAWEEAVQPRQAGNAGSFDGSSQQVNLELIRGWLNKCDHVHGSSCNSEKSEDLAADDMPIVFIDVLLNCLVMKTTREKYYALSYVWGAVEMHLTTTANIEARKQYQSLSKIDFPQTISDVMGFVRSLGGRFLWIDALCIAQDDHEQLARDIPRMNIVYGKSFATVVAVSGEDANAGLPGVRPWSRPAQEVSIIRVSDRSPELDYDSRSETIEEVCLVASPPALHLALEASKWNTRAWIFQERLLSRRCIYFFHDAVYFQCGKDTLSECGVNEVYSAYLFDASPLRDEHVLTRANHDNPLSDVDKMFYQPAPQRYLWAFKVYKRLIEVYSGRELSFKADILRGFAGVFAVLNRHFKGETLFGLPVVVFPHALLWSPAARLPRRGGRLATISNVSVGKPDRRFPSWSWAGWDGPVEYRLFSLADDGAELPKPMVARFRIGSGASQKIVETGEFYSGFVEGLPADDLARSGPVSAGHEPVTGKSINQESARGGPPTASSSGIVSRPVEAIDSREEQQTQTNADRKGKARARDISQVASPFINLVDDPTHKTTWVVAPPPPPQSQPEPDPIDDATMLSFDAQSLPLRTAFRLFPEKEYLSKQSHTHAATLQAVRRIYDRHGSHCGLWWEQAGYGYVGLNDTGAAAAAADAPDAEIHLVGISTCGSVWQARRGLRRVEARSPSLTARHSRTWGPTAPS